MRYKLWRVMLFVIVLCFIWYKYYLNIKIADYDLNKKLLSAKTSTKPVKLKISQLVTIILREFELYENDVTLTAQSFINMFPNIMLWIVYNEVPYPPLDLAITNNSLTNIQLYNLSPGLKHQDDILSQITTKYVLFVPDSSRITSQHPLQVMLSEIDKNPGSIAVLPVSAHSKGLKCLKLNINQREWTVRYNLAKENNCDEVVGKHLIMLEKNLLKNMYNPLLLPFPHALYLQSSFQNIQVKILKANSLHEGKPVLRTHHSQFKKKQSDQELLKSLYKTFKIKQIIRETGVTEWFGCSKETPRCFGIVLDSMPSYLFEKKWTPPCCMSNLRKTARHVFSALDEAGVRYWLEAGSLLGAMRSGDVLPWDHNVDIGFVRDDLNRCKWLKKAQSKPVVDKKGFLWEKGTEGNIFKVFYSKTNRINVNLFPFYSKNGTMTKDSWFTSHKNMEFTDSFLHPMSSIDFVGRSVPSPNNIRDFLELKYGKGCIENPEYPDPNKLRFP
ncbi:fukutin-related protein [Sitophilus oryzae]|uniref:Fukutin-related protein n=1 Tax=Sitophilus oryzae TaxID=7048 RepID=A0A6J2YAF7_SITOR|nr:fukutin-related protein [Sitophilus oryzae]